MSNMTFNNSTHSFIKCEKGSLRCNHWRLEYSDKYALEYTLAMTVAPIMYTLVAILGTIGNSLVIFIICKYPTMRTTTNIFVLNLALTDLIMTSLGVPYFIAYRTSKYWRFGEFMCSFVPYILAVVFLAGIYTLVLMTADRYLAIVHPLKSLAFRNKRNTTTAIVVLWIIVVITCIPLYPHHKLIQYNGTDYTDCIFLGHDEYRGMNETLCIVVTTYVLPLGAVLLLYAMVLRKVWRGYLRGDHECSAREANKKRVTAMVVWIVVAFAVCWAPANAYMLIDEHGELEVSVTNVVMEIVAYLFAMSNSCVNPFIYALTSDAFRKAYKKIFQCSSLSHRTWNERLPP